MGDHPCRKVITYVGQNKRRQTSMPRLGFKSTIPVFQWAKTFNALNHAATVISTGITQCITKMTKSTILEVSFLILKQMKNSNLS
jgi:hypothetical protein